MQHCNIPVLYHHSGHLGDQRRLAQVLDEYLTASKPVIVSQERHCITPFIQTADRLVVVDFPDSIDSYRDCKIIIDFNTQKGLITTLVSETEDHLLPELKDYILQKGEDLPPWLAQESVVSQGIAYPTVGVSSTRENFPQGNLKALSSCPEKSHKSHRRKHPPKPPFIIANILDRPLVPDPKKSWTQVSISTAHTQPNPGTNRPSQHWVRREITYKYGPGDAKLKADGQKYDALLPRHLLAIGERSPLESQTSSSVPHNVDHTFRSYGSSCPPSKDTDKCFKQRNSSVSKYSGLGKGYPQVPDILPKSQSSEQPHYRSIPSQSIKSHDLVTPKSNISQDPKPPMSPMSKAIVPSVATVAPIRDTNSFSCVDSGDDRDSDVSEDSFDDDPFKDSEDDINVESMVGSDSVIIASSDILKPSPYVLYSPNSQNTGNWPLSHDSSNSDDGTEDGSSTGLSTDDSDQEDFLQLGASQSATSAQTQTRQVSFPFMSSKSNTSDMANVGSLSGPRVPHTDMVKPPSPHSLTQEPVLVQPVRSCLVGKRIAAGLRFQQSTTGISDSLAVLPSEGGILHNSHMPPHLDNSESISDGYDSSVSLSNGLLNYKGLVPMASDQPQ